MILTLFLFFEVLFVFISDLHYGLCSFLFTYVFTGCAEQRTICARLVIPLFEVKVHLILLISFPLFLPQELWGFCLYRNCLVVIQFPLKLVCGKALRFGWKVGGSARLLLVQSGPQELVA